MIWNIKKMGDKKKTVTSKPFYDFSVSREY